MKNKYIVILLVFSALLSSFTSSFAWSGEKQKNNVLPNEIPGVQWSKEYGTKEWIDDIVSVRQTADGGYILVGETQSYSMNHYHNGWLIKTDASGKEIWNKTYGRPNDFGTSVQQTYDGGYILCGADPSGIWLVKTDADGVKQWEKVYAGFRGDCVRQVADGGYILTGWIGFGAPLIRTDANGTLIWRKVYFSSYNSVGWCVQQTSDGGFILAGDTEINSSLPQYGKGFLLKADQDGNEQWNKTYIWHSANYSRLTSVQQTPDHGYIVAGGTNGLPWIIRTNENGNELWNKTFIDQCDIATEVDQTNDDGFVIVTTNTDAYSCIIKIDKMGMTEWEICYGVTPGLKGIDLKSVQQTSDGGFIAAGNYVDYMIDYGFSTKIGHIPKVTIIKPTKGVYLFDRKVLDIFLPLAIGPITVEVNASDTRYNISRVEFYIGSTLKHTDTSLPYSWRWIMPSFFIHMLTVIAYNEVGNYSSEKIVVWKIL